MNTPNVTPAVSVAKSFVSDNWFSLLMFGVAGAAFVSILGNIAQHREDVHAVSVQNAGCIYLESSRLGEGQHYMICNGQITLKRIADGESVDTEKALEEVLPTEPANTTAQTPPPKN